MKPSFLTRGRGPYDGDVFALIVGALRHRGYIILDNVFAIDQLQSLFIYIKSMDRKYFHSAGVGREQDHQLNQFVRRDRICWLGRKHEPARFYLD